MSYTVTRSRCGRRVFYDIMGWTDGTTATTDLAGVRRFFKGGHFNMKDVEDNCFYESPPYNFNPGQAVFYTDSELRQGVKKTIRHCKKCKSDSTFIGRRCVWCGTTSQNKRCKETILGVRCTKEDKHAGKHQGTIKEAK